MLNQSDAARAAWITNSDRKCCYYYRLILESCFVFKILRNIILWLVTSVRITSNFSRTYTYCQMSGHASMYISVDQYVGIANYVYYLLKEFFVHCWLVKRLYFCFSFVSWYSLVVLDEVFVDKLDILLWTITAGDCGTILWINWYKKDSKASIW